MIFVYGLKNAINDEVYVGITSSPDRRVAEHNSGKNRYTKAFMPWSVFYTEQQLDYPSARRREKYLKSAAGKRFLKRLISKGADSLADEKTD